MFPKAYDAPACCLKRGIRLPVTFHVPAQLGCPIPLVRGGLPAVFGAHVPEAAVNEDSHLPGSEDDVRPYPNAASKIKTEILAVAVTTSMKRLTQRYLRFGVGASISAHVARSALVHRLRVQALGPCPLTSVTARWVRHVLAGICS